MTEYLLILVSTVFVNNIVMVKILGLCPFMGVSKKLEAAIGMGAATTFVLDAGFRRQLPDRALPARPRSRLPHHLSFIVIIAAIVQFTEMVIKKTSPVLYQMLGIYLPLITTNCAVLGIPLLNVQAKHDFMQSLLFGFGGAVGFTLVMILFAGIRERLEGADVPGHLQGHGHRHGHRRIDELVLHGVLGPGR